MKKLLAPLLLFNILCFAQDKQYINSVLNYTGDFNYGNYSTDIRLEIHQNTSHPKIFFSSIQQNAFQIPAKNINVIKDSLFFDLQSDYFRYQFRGKVVMNELQLNLEVDTVSQNFELTRTHVTNKITENKKEIQLIAQGLKLYGSIWYPKEPNGKAIYFVTSSGHNDHSGSRAEAILFSQKGYITFHIDKRGTGKSEGNWQTASIEELSLDDIIAIKFLSNAENIALSDIGIKGSSQGATKVPYILTQLEKLGFGIAVSCPGTSLLESDINYWKNRNYKVIGKEHIDKAMALQKLVYQYIAGLVNSTELEKEIQQNKDKIWFSHIWIPNMNEVQLDKKLTYSPIPFFGKMHQPLLLIQGTADQVIPKNSHEMISQALNNSNPKNQIKILDNADHSMYDKGQSDFPYWSALHNDYFSTMYFWINEL